MKSEGISFFAILLFVFLLNSCKQDFEYKIKKTLNAKEETISFTKSDTILKSYGLIDVQTLNNRILVDLKYASSHNFLSEKLYDDLKKAYLQQEVAQMLVKAQNYLDSVSPGMCLLIYDAVRPVDIQQKMWEKVKNTKYRQYVANPSRTSLHNFGAAVDLTIADSMGMPLDMGTPFDYFGKKAGINNEDSLVTMGLLTTYHIKNRKLLRKAMAIGGFYPIHGEWWHFNACSLEKAKKQYKLVLTLNSMN